ncbi:MAG: hypothetical protein ACOC8L_00480 [Spirochaetota bacterium]
MNNRRRPTKPRVSSLKRRWMRTAPIALVFIVIALATMPAPGQTASTALENRLLRDALFLSPEYTIPVTDAGGNALSVFEDFDRDGRLDVAVLTMAADSRIIPSLEQLGSRERLYDPATIRALFLVETLYQGNDGILTVELGRQTAVMGIEVIDLGGGTPAVQVGFRSQQGTSQQLVLYGEGGRASRFNMIQSASEQGSLTDIDNDGALEAVVARRLPEAGRGYETFVELFEHRRGAMVRTGGFSLVRTLVTFLEGAAAEIQAEQWNQLASRIAIPPAGVARAESSGDLVTDLLNATFLLVEETDTRSEEERPAGDPEHGILPTEVSEVVFTPFTENPFPEPLLGETIRISFRVMCCGGMLRIYEASLRLAQNPFSGEPFAFLTEGESQQ